MNKLMSFLRELISVKSDISSNRFLGVFIFSPVLIIMIFLELPMSYIYVVSGLITAFLVTNAVSKFSNNIEKDKKSEE